MFIRAVRSGARVWDVRPRHLYARDAVPGAVHVPLEPLRRGQAPDAPKDEPVYVVCEFGHFSELAGLYLEAQGFSAVFHLSGGMQALRRAAEVRDAKPGTEPR